MPIVLNDVVTPNNTSVVNANFTKIQDAINNDLLKRENEQGDANEMRTPLDMNQNKQVNLIDGVDPQDAATVKQMGDNLALTTAQRVLAESAATSADASDISATAQVPLAAAQVVLATDQVTLAADEVALATTQSGIATTQAGISTAQAVLSAQSAVDAQAAADTIVIPSVIVETIVAGTNITVDATDPSNPIVTAAGGASGGQVDSIVAGTNVTVDATDPVNPIVSAAGDPLTTKGDVMAFDTDANRLPVGTDDQVLTADSAQAFGVKWADAAGGGSIQYTQRLGSPTRTFSTSAFASKGLYFKVDTTLTLNSVTVDMKGSTSTTYKVVIVKESATTADEIGIILATTNSLSWSVIAGAGGEQALFILPTPLELVADASQKYGIILVLTTGTGTSLCRLSLPSDLINIASIHTSEWQRIRFATNEPAVGQDFGYSAVANTGAGFSLNYTL